jgi:uncharacterized protein Yka (UPF0111/DUF47 family)
VELFVTNQKTLEEDGWLPGSFEIEDDHEEAEKIKHSAAHYIESVLDFNPDATEQIDLRDKHLSSVEHLGGKSRKASNKLIGQICEHFPVIEKQLEERSWLSSNFNDIKALSQSLDPFLNHVKEDGIPRLLERISFIPTPARRYYSRFESQRDKVDQLVRSLEKVADVFEKDIELIKAQLRSMSQYCTAIGKNIFMGQAIDQGLQRALVNDLFIEDPRRDFIEKEQIPRLRLRVSNLRRQLDLNRGYITVLTVLLLNNESLNKALIREQENLAAAFNLGVSMARERINLSVRPLEQHASANDDGRQDGNPPRLQNLMSLSAAFSRTTDLADSVKEFIKKSLDAFKESASGLPQLQKDVEEAFQAARMMDLSVTAQDHDAG